jgi:protein ImuA
MAGNARAQDVLFTLREQIAKMEGKPLPAAVAAEQEDLIARRKRKRPVRLPFGIQALDEALDGGLLLDSITEVRSSSMYDAGAATGFVLSLASSLNVHESGPVLWIADSLLACESGVPYVSGISQFGIDPAAVLHASPRRLDDALWLAEAALASGAFAATIFEIHGNPKAFGLTESRRLGLRAKAAGRPLLLLRHAGEEEASSASFRLFVKPAPALRRRLPDGTMLGGSIGHPVFQLTLEKSRNPAPFSFLLEWNPHDRQFHLVAESGPSALSRRRPAHPGAQLPASGDRQDRPQALGAVVAFERAS